MGKKTFIVAIVSIVIFSGAEVAFCSNEDVHIVAGALAEKEGHFEAAEAEYKKALSENPKIIPVYYSLGGIYYKLKNYSAAVDVYKKGLNLFPNDYGLNMNIMHAYFDLGNIPGGIRHYKALSKIAHADKRYSFPRDSLQEITKGMSQEEIIAYCFEYLSINPTDNILRELLSSSYMNKRDYRSAKKEYKKLLEQGYVSGYIYFSLGVCDYYLGHYKDAKRNLTEAKKLGESVPSQYFDMVDHKISTNGSVPGS